MIRDAESGDSGAGSGAEGPISSGIALAIATERAGAGLPGARVEFGHGEFFGAPSEPVWIVRPVPLGDRLGGDRLIAICPTSGRVLFDGVMGE